MIDKLKLGRDRAVKREDGSLGGLDLVSCTDKPPCEDKVEIPAVATTKTRGLMVNDKEHLFDKEYQLDDPGLKSAIDKVVEYYEVSPKHVCAEYADGKYSINHIGVHTVGDLTGTTGAVLGGTVARHCTLKNMCKYKLDLPGVDATDSSSLVVKDDSGTEVVNEALGADYSTVNAANATALQTDIQGNMPTGSTATVTADTVATAYSIELELPEGYTASLGEEDFICCECEYKFT